MVKNEAIEEFVQAIQQPQAQSGTTYSAIVARIDDEGVVWVNLAGSNKETPTASVSSEVEKGDSVTVEWRNNKLYIAGNYSNPSAGTVRVQLVENIANTAQATSDVAYMAANNAINDAERAKAAADEAQGAATAAQASASKAGDYASRALGNLSTVQSVAETLNWITQHGTMTLTTDTALDPSHVYFVADQNGDYVVGGVHYSVVSEPDIANISTYYELSIDESLNNYVGTHLAVDSEGLWLIPETNGNKVLIATGSGNTYTTAGTYIIGKDNGTDVILAQFLSTGAVIGQTDNVHVEIDEDSFLMIDGSGNEFAHIGSPKDAQLTDTFVYSNSATFTLSNTPSSAVVVKVNGTVTTNFTQSGRTITVSDTLVSGDEVTIIYTTATEIKYYSFGIRLGDAGEFSVAEGDNITASGAYSHAEGSYTEAKGYASHAEGSAWASGNFSHAEGYASKAKGSYSHAEGEGSSATGAASHAEGGNTNASGRYAHAEGNNTRAASDFTHAEGKNTNAGSFCAHAEGEGSYAFGENSHSQNYYTVAQRKSQTAIGEYNVIESGSSSTLGTYALIIGNGSSALSRSNALAVTWDGNVEFDLAGYQTTGNVDKTIYDALVALGWDSEVTA